LKLVKARVHGVVMRAEVRSGVTEVALIDKPV